MENRQTRNARSQLSKLEKIRDGNGRWFPPMVETHNASRLMSIHVYG